MSRTQLFREASSPDHTLDPTQQIRFGSSRRAVVIALCSWSSPSRSPVSHCLISWVITSRTMRTEPLERPVIAPNENKDPVLPCVTAPSTEKHFFLYQLVFKLGGGSPWKLYPPSTKCCPRPFWDTKFQIRHSSKKIPAHEDFLARECNLLRS